MRNYVKYHFWEWLACLLVGAPLLLNLSRGFYIPGWAADSVPLAVAVTGVWLLFFFIGNYNKVTMICFPLISLALIAGFFFQLRMSGVDIGSGEGADALNIYWILSAMIPLVVFSLSRTRLGIAVLFLIGICLHGIIDFLAYDVMAWCTAVFTFACLCLFPLRQYRLNALRSSTVRPEFSRLSAIAACAAVVGLGLAMLLFFFVIRPLEPPTLDIRLISRTMRYDILERIGVARNYPIPDEMLRSQPEEDIDYQSDLLLESEDDHPTDAVHLPDDEFTRPDSGAALPSDADRYASISYEDSIFSYIIAIVVFLFLLCVSLLLLPRFMRRRMRARLLALGREELVLALFPRYLKVLKRIGLSRAPTQTALEYLSARGERISRYTEGAMGFDRLTEGYLRVRFGGLPVEDDVYEGFLAFFPIFARNYRHLEGGVRYFLRFPWVVFGA